MKLTVVCPIILISHIVQLFLIRKCYCFHNGRHIYFKYAQHNHLHCPMMGEVFLWLVLLDEKFVSAIKKIYIYIYGKKRKRKKKTTKVGEILSQSIDFREPKKFHVGALPFWGGGGLQCSLLPDPPPPPAEPNSLRFTMLIPTNPQFNFLYYLLFVERAIILHFIKPELMEIEYDHPFRSFMIQTYSLIFRTTY